MNNQIENADTNNTFKCQIDSGEAFYFPTVNCFLSNFLRITGAQEEFEQQIENLEFNFAPDIQSGEYKLNDPGVNVDVRTGWVNTRYTATSLTLKLTVDHSSKSISGVYAIQTVQDYGGVVEPGIDVNGNFAANYIIS
ncbi:MULTISPECIES: hypothetical protein [unclassified Pseudomonas]|jgi:hypothetical protein|uniref:hypothetical protein n=1 Tax=Pseudomonas TaxID=286 RepID=UPI0010227FB0|nr:MULTISPECIES: hypothetical protein [unclassified Pseudomonas]MCH4898647.1 hypothetical protein [Pseudomonas sp. B707]TEA63322.1 hypothetical protein EIY71_03110 [Pseudomonas sp. CH235]